jgi:hypothetical protein
MSFRKAMTAGEVGGGVSVDKHLMKLCSKTPQPILTLVCSAFESLKGLAVAKVPVGRLTRTLIEVVLQCRTVVIVSVERLVE